MRSRAQVVAAIAALALLATMVVSAPYTIDAQAAAVDTAPAAPEPADAANLATTTDESDEASLTVVDVDAALGFAATVAQQEPEPQQAVDAAATSSPETGTGATQQSVPAIDPSLPAADLSVTVSADRDPVLSDSFVTYTVEVANAGPAEAVNVVATDVLPDYMSFISMSGCWLANSTFPECHLNEIPAGESRSFDIVVMTSPGSIGTQITTVSVTSETADPDPTNNTASVENLINIRATLRDISATADLSIVKLDLVDPVPALGTINYSILVSNAGPNAGVDVEVTDVLPAGVSLVSAPGCAQTGNELICDLGTIPPGQVSSITVSVTADPGTVGDIVNTASVRSRSVDPIGTNNQTSQTTTVNSAPTATDDTQTVAENAGATIVDVLANDADADGDVLTVTAIDATGVTGIVALSVSGVVTYDPNGQFDTLAVGDTATDTFTYDISDGNGGTATATVTVTIEGVNEAPVAVADTATASEDGPAITIDVVANDTDANGDTLTAVAVSPAATGVAAVSAGVVTYDPNGQFESLSTGETATDTFTYNVSDGNGGTDTARVVVTVAGVDDAPVITSNGAGDTAAVSVDENTAAVTDVDSSDAEGDTEAIGLAYSLGGPDNGLFSVDPAGVVTFNAAPDFENPTDVGGDNVYDLTITVTDSSGLTDTQTLAITVTQVNEAPSISAPFGGSIEESTVGVLVSIASSDPEGETDNGGGLTYSLTGPDAGLFAIDANTGVLSLPAALDFENPTDVNGDNIYDMTFVVTDSGGLTDTQDLALEITNTNEAPTLMVPTSVTVPENTTAVVDVESSDPDGETDLSGALFYTLTGPDSALFSIDATGNITFNAAPDFETPLDVGGDNVYDLTITVTDSGGLTDDQAITVTVTPINEAPTLTAPVAGTVDENIASLTTITASDPEGETDNGGGLVYSLTGPDAALFAVTPAGVWSWIAAPDFENPLDVGGDNVYDLTFVVTDLNGAGLTDTQDIALTVSNVNEAPTVTAPATASVPENTTAVADADGSDPEGETESGGGLIYSLTGADASLFSIDAAGNLAFIAAPDFETALDVGADNTYNVTITVTDLNGAGLSDDQAIAVTVTPVNEAPTITAPANVNIGENVTGPLLPVSSSDPEGETAGGGGLTYSLTGPDAGLFALDANSGVWSVPAAIDFEIPSDANGDGTYELTFNVTDSGGLTGSTNTTVMIIDIDEAPTITAPATASVPENTTAVADADATDPEGQTDNGGGLTYSLLGPDAGLFSVNAVGTVVFTAAPDFETPLDVGADNVYDVTIRVSDTFGNDDDQAIAVSVIDGNEAPTIVGPANVDFGENVTGPLFVASSSDPEGETDSGGGLTYSLTGPDAGLFALDANSGVWSVPAPIDFEIPSDANGDGTYELTFNVTDSGGLTGSTNTTVMIIDVDEAPTITAPATASVPENTTAVADADATDPEGQTDNGGGLTYSLLGPDAGLFSVNAVGTVVFTAAPDFETPLDVGADNVYDVTIRVSDTFGNDDDQAIAVSVIDGNEAPTIVGPANVDFGENVTGPLFVASSSDPEGETDSGGGLTYSLTGPDAGLFALDANSGVWSVPAPIDFEIPSDANGDGTYELTFNVTDSGGLTGSANTIVMIIDVNEAPTITAPATANVPENTTAVIDITASDPDGETESGGGLVYSRSGPDGLLFSIDAAGNLAFINPPDRENPLDVGGDNTYNVTVMVTDLNGAGLSAATDIAITVTDQDDPPVITSDGAGATAAVNSAEDQTTVTDVNSTDDEGDTEAAGLTYALTGDDASFFTLDTDTGVLAWLAAPDFETPLDSGADGVYDVIVTVTDTQALTDVQAIAVTVTNVNELPSITSANSASVVENTTAVIDVDSTDPDGETENGGGLVYSRSGPDGLSFSIQPDGNLAFITAPNFDIPGDANGDNVYELTIMVTDGGGLSATQNFTVTVTGVNEAPEITSDGGGDTAAITATQGDTAVTTVTSTDPEGETDNGGGLTYALSGTDSASFGLTQAGVLTFNVAPAAAATLDITVTVTDSGGLADTQDITITVPPNTAPTPVDDAYLNLPVNVRLDAGTGTAGIDVDDTDGVLTKGTDDSDPEGSALTVVGIVGCADVTAPFTGCATTGGGVVDMNADGTFTYVSQAGETAATDTFDYTVSDGSLTADATVTVTFGTDTIWFIDAAAAGGGNGTSPAPFNTVAAFNAAATDPGDIAYLQTGTYNGSGFTLAASQQVIGAGVALMSGALSIPAGVRPTLTATTGNAVTLSTNNTVRGLNITDTPGGTAFNGSNVGTPAINAVDISGSGGIMSINGGNLANVALGNSSSTNAPANGLSLQNLTGMFNPVGSIDITNSGSTAAQFVNNSSATITIPDLDIDNSSSNQRGIQASGGGSLQVSTGTVNAGSATAVDVNSLSIGVLLRRVDSVGGTTPGISLVNTTGFFTVTGSSVGCQSNAASCSGGSVTGKTGDGVFLNDVTNVTLNDMNISNNSGNGVSGTTVNAFTIDDSRLDSNADSVVQDEAGLKFVGLTGTATVSNTTISNSHEHNAIVRNSSGTLTNLAVTNSTFGPNPSATGANGLLFQHTGGTQTLTVTNSTFNDNRGFGIQADTSGGSMNVNVSTSNFTSTGQTAGAGQNVAVGISTSSTGSSTFNILNNPVIEDHRSNAINIFTNGSGTLTGTIQGNTIGTNGDVSSGSSVGSGIRISNEGTGTLTTLVDNNTIQEIGDGAITGFNAITVFSGVSSNSVNATITNNTLDQIRDDRALSVSNVHGGTLCANVSANTFTNINAFGDSRLRLSSTGLGLGGSVLSTQTSEANLESVNGGHNFDISGTITFGQSACATP